MDFLPKNMNNVILIWHYRQKVKELESFQLLCQKCFVLSLEEQIPFVYDFSLDEQVVAEGLQIAHVL